MTDVLVSRLRTVLPTEEEGRAFVRANLLKLGTLDAIPFMRRGFERPGHLAELASVFRRAELAACGNGEPVFACFSAPSQVGKTTGIEVSYSTWLARHPDHTLAYLPYGADLAADKSRRIRDDVRELGVKLRGDSTAVDYWQTEAGGGLIARGIGGGVTGMSGARCLALDDLYRNRMEAQSAAHRKRVQDAVRAVVFTRRQPHTSIVISFTRWDMLDIIGWLHSEADEMAKHGVVFEFYRVPAVDDDGEPIITIGGRTKEFWRQQRALMGEHDWWSLMMGLPRPREGRLFKGSPPTYAQPSSGHQCVRIGVDFAYSRKTSADHNAAVVVGKTHERYEVLHVVRRQCDSVTWAGELRALKTRYPAASFHAYIGGTELGTIDMLRAEPYRVHVEATTARADKYSRAQATAAAWSGNEADVIAAREATLRGELVHVPALVPRRVYVPAVAVWDVAGFVERTLDFTGHDGGADDEQDALVSAVDACGPIIGRRALTEDDEDRVGPGEAAGFYAV